MFTKSRFFDLPSTRTWLTRLEKGKRLNTKTVPHFTGKNNMELGKEMNG
jgi:hypothetical protein